MRCAIDSHWDQSLIELTSVPTAKGVCVATANPQPGERVVALGYAFGREMRQIAGSVLNYASPSNSDPGDWFAFSGSSTEGCSGGPIFNQRGELIGNLWGSRGTDSYKRGCHVRQDAAVPVAVERQARSSAIGTVRQWAMRAAATTHALLLHLARAVCWWDRGSLRLRLYSARQPSIHRRRRHHRPISLAIRGQRRRHRKWRCRLTTTRSPSW